MAEFLKRDDFKPELKSKVTQVNAAMQALEAEIDSVYLAGELDAAKTADIKKRIEKFDRVLIDSPVIKQFLKDDPNNMEEIKKISDAIQARIEEMIKEMEQDIDIKSKADFATNIQELKDNKETETSKVVDRIDKYTHNRDKIDFDEMLKAAKQEYYINDIKMQKYDDLAAKKAVAGYTVEKDEKKFNEAFDASKKGSIFSMIKSSEAVKAGEATFKADYEAAINGIRTGSITKADAAEIKKIEDFLRNVSDMPKLDPAFKANITAALTAIKNAKSDPSKFGTIQSALAPIDPETIKDDIDLDKNNEEIKNRMKDEISKGFLSYMPDKSKDFLKKIDDGKPLAEVAEELSKFPTTGTYKATFKALKDMETESAGKSKDDYLQEITNKRAAAFDKMNTLKEMEEVTVPDRPTEKPKFDLSSIGLEAETDTSKPGLNATQFEYTKKDGDSYVDIDARDEDLQQTDIDTMADNLWEKMSAKQKNKMNEYTETHLSVPPRGFAYGIRAFFQHLRGRQTYREREIDRLTKESIKKQISDQGKDTRTASIREEAANAPLRAQRDKADKLVLEYAEDYDKSVIGQVIDKGSSVDMKDIREEANKKAMQEAQNRRATRAVDDEGR